MDRVIELEGEEETDAACWQQNHSRPRQDGKWDFFSREGKRPFAEHFCSAQKSFCWPNTPREHRAWTENTGVLPICEIPPSAEQRIAHKSRAFCSQPVSVPPSCSSKRSRWDREPLCASGPEQRQECPPPGLLHVSQMCGEGIHTCPFTQTLSLISHHVTLSPFWPCCQKATKYHRSILKHRASFCSFSVSHFFLSMLFIPLALPKLCVAHACMFSARIPVVSYASLGSPPLSPSTRVRAFRELNYLSFLCSQKRL